MDDQVLLGSGRDADVFALDEGRVLRRYRAGGDVAAEAAIMAYVGSLGYPVPRVDRAEGPDLVMERIDGPTMLRAMVEGELAITDGAEILADLHRRLHELPPRPNSAPGTRVLHLDLHPDNVLLGPRGPVVIDWLNGTDGEPELDLALSALIAAEVAVNDMFGSGALAESFLRVFLGAVSGDPLRLLDSAVARRRGNPTLSAEEVSRLDSAATLVRALSTDVRQAG
ncbi:phosphotransferase [Plantactinospora solaniradicis]|uniref:Phosphotransferase n=1 Tax=Plantactinospora solaniradicis TaxID=1723736 RepID=A0ABW1KEW8_9ACTN